jgi:hypothetical protein
MEVNKGDVSEVAAIKELLRLGFEVHVPWGDNTRHDLLAEVDNEFLKIQVKTAYEATRENRITAKLCTTNPRTNEKKFYTEDDVDVYVLYYPETDECFWIPFEEAPERSITLALEYKQMQPSVRPVEQYKIENRLST